VSTAKEHYDVVVAGGGHNGLVAASYLARAGLSVLVLERRSQVGGAAVSTRPFRGHGALVSPYSRLMSLPQRLVQDLELDLRLAPRPSAEFAGSPEEYDAWREFHADIADLAHSVAPTLLDPLPTEREVRDRIDTGIWRDFVTNPLGATIEERFGDDAVRGMVASDGLVGISASLHDPSLAQNRCFLYHGIGEWRVPIGGLGVVSEALALTARKAGAEIVTDVGVSAIRGGDEGAEVSFHDGQETHTVGARFALADVAPWVLQILLGSPDDPETKPQGAQLMVDLLLHRLPRLRSGADPAVALASPLHVAADYTQLEKAYAEASAGQVPSPIPGRLECPSLTDPSLLGEADGLHTLSFFGFHTPARLFEGPDREAVKQRAVAAALMAINEQLEEPIDTCLAADADGRPCLQARIPQDVEADLAMPGGHLFHGDLDWPWASNRARLDTPAQQWGVQTDVGSVMVCGSGARRGGGITGLGGHNAAQAVLATVGG
jgi:phytoene dehydrogenase-like protein